MEGYIYDQFGKKEGSVNLFEFHVLYCYGLGSLLIRYISQIFFFFFTQDELFQKKKKKDAAAYSCVNWVYHPHSLDVLVNLPKFHRQMMGVAYFFYHFKVIAAA